MSQTSNTHKNSNNIRIHASTYHRYHTSAGSYTHVYTHTQTKTDKRTFKSVNPPPCLRNHNHNHSFFLCILSLRLCFFSRISPLICRNLIFMTNNKTHSITSAREPDGGGGEGRKRKAQGGGCDKKDGNH